VRFLANLPSDPSFRNRGLRPGRTRTGHPERRRHGLYALVAVLTLAVLSVAPSGASAAAGSSAVQFNRTAFSDLTSTSNAAKYQFITLGYPPSPSSQAYIKSLIASIHQSDPGTRVLVYKAWIVAPSDPQGIGGCAPWNSSQPYGGVPTSWFLKDAGGAPMWNSNYSEYELDPSNPQVQQACLTSAVNVAKAGGYDGVFWDGQGTSLYWMGLSASNCSSTICQSDTNFHAAMTSWITTVSAGLHANGLLAFGNIAGGCSPLFGGGPAWWQAYQLDGYDGAEEESFTSGTNHLPMVTSQWKQELANEAWSEANGKYLLANADIGGNVALNTYGLATLLLASQGYSSWNTDSGYYSSPEFWLPVYDTALTLGAPLGSYSVQANGLYVRQFQHGSVVVNPNTAAISDPVYGNVAGQTGLILGPGAPPPTPPATPGQPSTGTTPAGARAGASSAGTTSGAPRRSHRASKHRRHRRRHHRRRRRAHPARLFA
jgi:Hypothetical glycosyl hydrolase family 15